MNNKLTNILIEQLLPYINEEINLLFEASARIQHAEDLIFWEGSKGAIKALKSIEDLSKSGYKDVTIKWDGSPAIIFGRNNQGQFVLTDKGGFVAKGYKGKTTSAEELQQMFLNRPGASGPAREGYLQLAGNMKAIFPIFEKATPANFRGYYKGDLLYFNTPKIIDGRYVFKPNVVTYSIDVNSELGEKISKSKTGVVIHRLIDEDGNEYPVKGIENLIQGELLVVPPVSVSLPPKIDNKQLKQLQSYVSSNASKIDDLLDKTKLSAMKLTDFADILYTYTNSKVDSGLEDLGKDFLKWLQTSKVSDVKKKKITDYVQQNADAFDALWKIVSQIMVVKDNIIDQIDAQTTDIKASINNIPGGEGYVMAGKYGDIKLVKRSAFSAANRALRREDINEGGWLKPELTSKTKLTPNIVSKVKDKFELFLKDLNAYLTSKQMKPVDDYKVLGSAGYYEKDLEDKVDTHYGDTDIMIAIPIESGEDEVKTKSKYLKAIVDFATTSNQNYIDKESAQRSGGAQLIIKIDEDNWVQIDMLATLKPYKEWFASRFSPQRGLKGFVMGALYSAIADVFSLSISYREIGRAHV